MDWHKNSLSSYNQKLQWFTENKKGQRASAKSMGLCTRCVVRRARSGKAYCQSCTEYAKRYARNRNRGGLLDSAAEPYRDKIMRIADYGTPPKEATSHQLQGLSPILGALSASPFAPYHIAATSSSLTWAELGLWERRFNCAIPFRPQ